MGSRGSNFSDDGTKKNVSLNENGLTDKEQRRAKRLAKTVRDFFFTYGVPSALTQEQQQNYGKMQNAEQKALYELAYMADKVKPHSMDALLSGHIYTTEEQITRAVQDMQKILNVKLY